MKLTLLPAILLFFAATLAAQSPAKILKQAERAMGGAKALRAVQSWQKRGTVKRISDGARGSIVMQSSRPNFYNLSFDIDGFEIESGYNGKSGWRRDSRSGIRTLTGDASIDFQAEASFRSSLWFDAKREKSKITAGGKGMVGDRSANIVIINTTKGAAVKLYFDATSNLLLKEEFSSGDSSRSLEYADHRPVSGISRPHLVTMEIDGIRYEAVFDEIRANAPVAKSEFDFPNLSAEPLPHILTLLAEVQANEDRVENLLDTYSFMQRSTARELGKDGVLRDKESETFQLSFYKGNRIRRLIERNQKPLSESDQQKEDREVAKRVEEIERLIAKKEKDTNGPPSEESRRISLAEVLRASTLSNARRERFRGRDVIVFDFGPNPAFDYKNAKSMLKFFGKTAGVMWIDEKDKQIARLEAFLADSFKIGGGVVAKLKKGASFTLEQERINDEVWLPSVADINLSVRVFLVKGIDLNQVIRSYDYRKFSTEVKDARVNPTSNQ